VLKSAGVYGAPSWAYTTGLCVPTTALETDDLCGSE